MIELAQYLLGTGLLVVVAAVALAQIGWQGCRVMTARPGWKLNALLILGLTFAAIAPPHAYRDLDRMIICGALVILPCLAALIGDPGWWKLLSAAHIAAACLWVFVCVQAAR